MIHGTRISHHKSGRLRGYLLKDPSLSLAKSGSSARVMSRTGVAPRFGLGAPQINHRHANAQYQHAFPLLTHDDFGHSDQSADTKHIMYSMYMPKKNKGTAPWFRGADTYSVKYSEQGRYEYQRYLMINRFPSQYKKHFMRFLGCIRGSTRSRYGGSLPQEALHWLYRMIVDNFNPQHVHYQAAMLTLMAEGEIDMARDAWKLMERQRTIPCVTTLSVYLDVCLAAKESSWALEAWNRYGTELAFLREGEVDPKPISRIPFSLTREELLYLPKWKKHFDHDPNLDVTDLNRFNKTREVYLKMALVLLASPPNGTSDPRQGFSTFFDELEKNLLATPTPVPEPPNPHLVLRPRWSPYEVTQPAPTATAWRLDDHGGARGQQPVLGESTAQEDALHHRFYTNAQFLVYSVKEVMRVLSGSSTAAAPPHAASGSSSNTHAFWQEAPPQVLKFADEMVDRLFARLGSSMTNMPTEQLLTEYLNVFRVIGKETGEPLKARADAFLSRKAAAAAPASDATPPPVRETLNTTAYLVVLRAIAAEGAVDAKTRQPLSSTFSPKATLATLARILDEMKSVPSLKWSLDMHLCVVQTLVRCGTMKANEYFVKNVLRQYRWTSEFLEALYEEYRRHESIDMWAELTKRALVWTARYDVEVSETLKRVIEDDYDTIHVQTRSFRELAVFQFRDVEEKRHARNAVNELPNPWNDYVSHALPFPDRDAGYPDEYGDIGQWRAPGGPGSPTKGPGYYSPPLEGEHQRGYHAEWRDLKNKMRPPTFPNPWERKYKEYARGTHPSYDMIYAGPMPEIFPGRHDWRKPTRWDFQDIEKQGKFRISGPW